MFGWCLMALADDGPLYQSMIMMIDITIALATFNRVSGTFTRIAFGGGFHIMRPWVYDKLNVDWITPSVIQVYGEDPTITAKSACP